MGMVGWAGVEWRGKEGRCVGSGEKPEGRCVGSGEKPEGGGWLMLSRTELYL